MVHERERLIVCCTPFFGDDLAVVRSGVDCARCALVFFHRSRQAPMATAAATAELQHRHRRAADGMDGEAQTRRPDHHYGSADHLLGCALVAHACGRYAAPSAYSFNFPELPRGWKRRLFSYAYERVDDLRVHSNMEIQLYHDYFSIPKDRIHLSLWSMNPPEVEPGGSLITGDYMTAIGGNSRDYQTLLAACWKTPEIPMVWVVRPENVAGLDLPPHVRVFCNTSYPVAMNYLAHSRAMVLPLKGAEVPCGHVTLVSAMFLGKAILATDSAGIHDYVAEGVTGMLCRPADPEHMVSCMRLLWRDRELNERMGENGLRFAETFCTESHARARNARVPCRMRPYCVSRSLD